MKGKILNFEKDSGKGLISSEDDKRYKFNKTEWKEKFSIKRGMIVDFDISLDGTAQEIFFIDEGEPPQKGWIAKMSSTEKYFWGFILFFMLLYIIANLLIYSHQKKRSIEKQVSPVVEQKSISNNLKNNNSVLNKDMYNKIDILYEKIDKILLKDKPDSNAFDQKLNKTYDEYRILIKKHVIFIDEIASKGIDANKYEDSVEDVYINLKNDSLIQKSKKRITPSGDNSNIEKVISQIKNGYHKKFIAVSEQFRKIYIDTKKSMVGEAK